MEHLPQVRLVARRIQERLPKSISFEDLVSAGTLGLIAAIDNFDATLNVKLATYAEYKIRGAILDSVRRLDSVGREARERARRIAAATETLEQRWKCHPKEEEIAAELGITLLEFQRERTLAAGATRGVSAVYPMRSTENAGPKMDPDDRFEEAQLALVVRRQIEDLPYRERCVLALFYIQELKLREIADALQTSISDVANVKSRGLERLRLAIRSRWPRRGTSVSASPATVQPQDENIAMYKRA